MKGVAFYFFATAVVAVTVGMLWGIQMSASGDHTMAGAHAHLNLVGWVTMALFGIYYHVVPAAAASRLALVHYGVAVVGLVLMIWGIATVLAGGPEAIVATGSMITAASMLIFLYTVFRHGISRQDMPAQPAE